MTVVAMIIQLNTKKIVDSNNRFLRLSDKTVSRHYYSLNYNWTFLSQNSCQNAMILSAHRNRIRIDFNFESQQINEKVFAKTRRFQLTNCNFILREIKSLANDLIAQRDRVNDKVILLLRFTERQSRNRLNFFQRKHSAFFHRWYWRYKGDIEEKKKRNNEKKKKNRKRKERKQKKRTKKENKKKEQRKRTENRKRRIERKKKQKSVSSSLKNSRRKCERIKSFDFLSTSTFKSDKKARIE